MLDAFIEGYRYRIETQLSRPAMDFVVPQSQWEDFDRLVRFNTGKHETQLLCSVLVILSALGGEWHEVPWRMLRNYYMDYGTIRQLLLRWQKSPKLPDEEPAVVYADGETPMEELLIGVKDMLDRGFAEMTLIDDEAHFSPTEKLLACHQGVA
jgi:hypothetical protein